VAAAAIDPAKAAALASVEFGLTLPAQMTALGGGIETAIGRLTGTRALKTVMFYKTMKTKRNLIPIWLLCATLLATVAQAQFTFTTNNGAITITGYTGANGPLVIPSATNGWPVTSIGDEAFFNGQGKYFRLTGVTIPDSVTNIGNGAFTQCSSLINVTIGTNVINIGTNAFQYCSRLTNLAIPASVTNIGPLAFLACNLLQSITVDTNNPAYGSLAGVLFDKSSATLIICPGAKAGSYSVPGTVTSIANWAFEYCANLSSIAIPAGVTNIGIETFKYCTYLTAITVDTNNPDYASIAGILFNGSRSVLLQYPEGIAGGYTVPGSVTSIGDEAFYNCAGLTVVTLPNSLTNIGNMAFYGCASLTAGVVIGDNVIHLGDDAFGICSSLKSIVLGNGLIAIGTNEFLYCSGLTNVVIGTNVTNVATAAFEGCSSLTSVTLPGSVTNLGIYAFYYCSGLTNVTIPDSVITIGDGAFVSCYKLAAVNLPPGITSIGNNMFSGCTSLANITIPAGVTNIGYDAFYSCHNLKGVYFLGNAPTVATYVFGFDNNVTAYYLPGTTGWADFAAATGIPTMFAQALTGDGNFGVRTNQFGFNITGSVNIPVVVEACTNLTNPVWQPVQTNMLTGGTSYFSDSQWTNYPNRSYRIRSP